MKTRKAEALYVQMEIKYRWAGVQLYKPDPSVLGKSVSSALTGLCLRHLLLPVQMDSWRASLFLFAM